MKAFGLAGLIHVCIQPDLCSFRCSVTAAAMTTARFNSPLGPKLVPYPGRRCGSQACSGSSRCGRREWSHGWCWRESWAQRGHWNGRSRFPSPGFRCALLDSHEQAQWRSSETADGSLKSKMRRNIGIKYKWINVYSIFRYWVWCYMIDMHTTSRLFF